jgi:hypothetical protein
MVDVTGLQAPTLGVEVAVKGNGVEVRVGEAPTVLVGVDVAKPLGVSVRVGVFVAAGAVGVTVATAGVNVRVGVFVMAGGVLVRVGVDVGPGTVKVGVNDGVAVRVAVLFGPEVGVGPIPGSTPQTKSSLW